LLLLDHKNKKNVERKGLKVARDVPKCKKNVKTYYQTKPPKIDDGLEWQVFVVAAMNYSIECKTVD